MNDYLSSRREERREQREIHAHREQWEREDHVRKDREDRERALEGTLAQGAAHRDFMDVTSAPDNLGNSPTLAAYLAALDRVYMDVLLVSTDRVRRPAGHVYETARRLAKLSVEDYEDRF